MDRDGGAPAAYISAMEIAIAVMASAALLFLVARGTPGRHLLVIVAVALAVVVLIVAAEQAGWWPRSWKTR